MPTRLIPSLSPLLCSYEVTHYTNNFYRQKIRIPKNGTDGIFMNRKQVIGGLILAIVIFPFVVIQFTLAKAEQGAEDPRYIIHAQIREMLGETETLMTKFQYFLVEKLAGDAPATEFVVLISTGRGGLTRGLSNVKLESNQEFWGHGFFMDPARYENMGDEYIFFGLPQVYLWQIKGTLLWPDQTTALKLLYQAPIARLTALYYVVAFPLMDEFTLRHYVAFIAQTVLIVATIVLAVKKREDKWNLLLIVLAYILLTMLITSPVLPNPYWYNYESLYFP